LISNILPETFDHEKVIKVKSDACTYCAKPFGTFKTSRHNCNRCGACVCDKCSENKEQLSRSDQTKYRICNMCHAIRKNKPIIVFYNDLDKAKQTRLEGLQVRKMNYKEQLFKDDADIRRLKKELEEQKIKADQELEALADELRSLKAEQLSNKESTKSLN
jgi:hypothetical protein